MDNSVKSTRLHTGVPVSGEQRVVEVASYLANGDILSIYQHLQTNLQQSHVERFFIKISVGGMLGLLLLAATLGVAVPGA